MTSRCWLWLALLASGACQSETPASGCPPGSVPCGANDDDCCQLCNTDSECTPTCSVEHPDGYSCVEGVCVRECGCVTNCALDGAECGVITNSCGDELDCGECDGDDICGGGGAPNTCGSEPCVPGTCESLAALCGAPSNGCDGTLECGDCGLRASCSEQYACVCDDGWGDCEADGDCLCDLNASACFQGGCCLRDCTDKSCGDDGCGGECGTCAGAHSECNSGLCLCTSGWSDCGVPPDGDCECDNGGGQVCAAGACCTPDCLDKECGDDGCGLVNGCGTCGSGGVCNSSQQCECDATHADCDDDGTCECDTNTHRCDASGNCCQLQQAVVCVNTGSGCVGGDGSSTYWQDSCGNDYQLIEDCEYRCSTSYGCWECRRCTPGGHTCGAWSGTCGGNPQCAWECRTTGGTCDGTACTDWYLYDICDSSSFGPCDGGTCSSGVCINCN